MSTLIGVPDVSITESHTVNYFTNKTGGSPNFYPGVDIPCPLCALCSNKLHLVIQLYCPLEGSNFHRTLYIFACSSPSCWNKSESWLVYRCQSEVVLQQKPIKESSHVFNDDWGGDGDDWGSDTDDWGTSGGDTSVNALGDKLPDSQIVGKTENNWGSDNHTIKKETSIINEEKLNENYLEIKGEKEDDTEGVCGEKEVDIPLETMCLEDEDDSDGSADVKHVISEDIKLVSDSEKSDILSRLGQSSNKEDGQTAVLESHFINVFEESDISADNDVHVSKLLKEYERREGKHVTDVPMETGSFGGGNVEKYEKTVIKHGDVYFHKFMKQIAQHPEQCVRYCWNGTPLYLRSPASHPPIRCCHCQGEMVFELQLMPSLVNLLKFTKHSDAAVEFGATLIFSCKSSCWTGGDQYRTEHILVQSDPDHERFQ